MRRLILSKLRAASYALALVVSATGAAAQGQVDLTFDQARLAGRQAALGGNAQLALQLADSLLQASDQDFDAWVIRASALLQLGDAASARAAAATAYRTAPDGTGRYEAARLAAFAAVNTDQFTLAQWWLRLALVNAPNERTEAQTRADAAEVRAQNPWQTNVTVSFEPSNNVNGGTKDVALVIDGLDYVGLNSADALALEGWLGSLAFSTRYRLHEDAVSSLTAGLNASWRGVFLSDTARDSLIADDRYFGNNAFSSRTLEANLSYGQATANGSLSLGSAIGSRFTFDDDDAEIERYLRLSARQSYTLDAARVISISAYASQAWDLDTSGADDLTLGASATYIRALPNLAVISGTLSYATTLSDVANRRRDSWTFTTAFEAMNQIGPFGLSGHFGYQSTEYADYATLFAVPGGRQDNRVFAGLDLAIPDWSFAGFEPVITLDASRTTSNVSRFEYDALGLGLTFQSSF